MARESAQFGMREIEVEVSAVAVEIESARAAEAEDLDEVGEVRDTDTVDGDFNGAPVLEALDATKEWQGADALDAMEGRDAQAQRASDEPIPMEQLSDTIADRRQLLAERMDEAREVGLESVFQAALAASEPEAGTTPVVEDADVLRDQIAILDAATALLERATTEAEAR